MPLTGIHNENEFFSHHYLAEIFTGDIQATVERWRKQAESTSARAPYAELRALAPEYLRFRRDFQRERRTGHRIIRQREWFRLLLAALGYRWRPANLVLEDGAEIPILCAEGGTAGTLGGAVPNAASAGDSPRLLVLGAFDVDGEGEDPLVLKPHPRQFHGEAPPPEAVLKETWNAIVTRRLFFPGASASTRHRTPEGVLVQTRPPRWVLILSCNSVLLLERGKWTHNRLLRFDFDDILSLKDDATLKAAAALLHRESLLPASLQSDNESAWNGRESLLDRLDDNSHKHAFAVSEDLKHALRELVTEHTPADDILNITVCEPAMGSAAFKRDVLNLPTLPGDYLPRTNHVPVCSAALERTLATAITPKGVSFIHTCVATTFRDAGELLDFAALSMSIVLDFFMKTTGAGYTNLSWLSRLPMLTEDCNPHIWSPLKNQSLAPTLPNQPLRRPVVRYLYVSTAISQRHHDDLYRRLPPRRLDAPRPVPPQRLAASDPRVAPRPRPAHRLCPPPSPTRNRRLGCQSPQPNLGRAPIHLPGTIPSHAAVRSGDVRRRQEGAELNTSHAHMLVDYDNVEELNRHRGLVDLVTTMLTKLPEDVTPDNAMVSIRLYGGWYERDRPTSLAQELRSKIAQHFPAIVRLGQANQRRVRTVVDLARSLLILPNNDLFNTFRHRRGAPRLRSVRPPYDNCAAPSKCALSAVDKLLKAPRCPAETCRVRLRDAFTQPQQKLVDTMLTADAIFVAHSRTPTKLVIVTNDDDLWPAICTAGNLGAEIYHLHPRRGRKTSNLYLPSAPPNYYQCSF